MIEMTTYPTMPPKESNAACKRETPAYVITRSEEHTSELQSQSNLVCRLLLEKKKKNAKHNSHLKFLRHLFSERSAPYTDIRFYIGFRSLMSHELSARPSFIICHYPR